jgi:hypothetical protein
MPLLQIVSEWATATIGIYNLQLSKIVENPSTKNQKNLHSVESSHMPTGTWGIVGNIWLSMHQRSNATSACPKFVLASECPEFVLTSEFYLRGKHKLGASTCWGGAFDLLMHTYSYITNYTSSSCDHARHARCQRHFEKHSIRAHMNYNFLTIFILQWLWGNGDHQNINRNIHLSIKSLLSYQTRWCPQISNNTKIMKK